MPRPSWTGAITFGMVTIPVRLFPAVRRKTVAFNQLDTETNSRIRYRKVSEATGEEVPPERIAKGVELAKGDYLVVTDDDLTPLAPLASHQISLETFVPATSLDPVMFDASYHVVPDKLAKPYALLTQAMAGTDRVGIGRFVMRQKGYLAAIRSDGHRLVLSTLVYPDELVEPDAIEDFEVLRSVELSDREVAMARTLVDALSDDFDHGGYVDEYRAAVEQLIEQKVSGRAPVSARISTAPASVVDLMEALQASLAEAQAARGRHPSARGARRGATSDRVPASEPADAPVRKSRRPRKSA